MITSNEFKTGMAIEYEGNIYTVVEFQHVKPGKGQAFVRTKLRNLRTGTITDFAFAAGEKMIKAEIEKKKMQYLYNETTSYAFMDMETYEQIDIPSERLEWEKNFLVEGMPVIIVDYQGEILGIQLLEKVAIKVVQADPAVLGNTAANATKSAVLETGWRLQVPMFIKENDSVIVNTATGKYDSRA